MKKLILLTSVSVFLGIYAISCKKDNATQYSDKEVYLDLSDSNAVYFYQHNYLNSTVNKTAVLGRVLFYDRHLSLNNSVSCASCHKQAYGFADNVALSNGFENVKTDRNSSHITNIIGVKSFNNISSVSALLFWDGRQTSLTDMVTKPIGNHVEMGISDISTLPQKLAALPYYKELFKRAYGTSEITVERIAGALGTFLSAINSDSTRFDKVKIYRTVQYTALEEEGWQLFNVKYNCASCHHLGTGTYFQNGFEDIGLDDSCKDMGRGAISLRSFDNGKFKTPNLKNVAVTGPYMHDGRFKTLKDVLNHYSDGIKNSANLSEKLKDANDKPLRMKISDGEKDALIAFLNTLTDYKLLTDSKFSDPFKLK
ncbi:MAG TPA: cytochrome c peroxidase [Flavipsychrobacter sp.]|nr:cytochrome c peroxidase [Flavipsychrobacter sp.]